MRPHILTIVAVLATGLALGQAAARGARDARHAERVCFPAKAWNAPNHKRPCVLVRVHEDGGVVVRRGPVRYFIDPSDLVR